MELHIIKPKNKPRKQWITVLSSDVISCSFCQEGCSSFCKCLLSFCQQPLLRSLHLNMLTNLVSRRNDTKVDELNLTASQKSKTDKGLYRCGCSTRGSSEKMRLIQEWLIHPWAERLIRCQKHWVVIYNTMGVCNTSAKLHTYHFRFCSADFYTKYLKIWLFWAKKLYKYTIKRMKYSLA